MGCVNRWIEKGRRIPLTLLFILCFLSYFSNEKMICLAYIVARCTGLTHGSQTASHRAPSATSWSGRCPPSAAERIHTQETSLVPGQTWVPPWRNGQLLGHALRKEQRLRLFPAVIVVHEQMLCYVPNAPVLRAECTYFLSLRVRELEDKADVRKRQCSAYKSVRVHVQPSRMRVCVTSCSTCGPTTYHVFKEGREEAHLALQLSHFLACSARKVFEVENPSKIRRIPCTQSESQSTSVILVLTAYVLVLRDHFTMYTRGGLDDFTLSECSTI